jgi:2-polyprenyl-6-methoxyphenol hydroxylase-like FAD-dependent oxidoreductase
VDWPDTPLPDNQLSQRYRRADRMIGALPIGRLPNDPIPKAAIFWSLPAGGHGAWQQAGLARWKTEATTLWPEFAPFLEGITDTEQMTLAAYTHGTLRKPWGHSIAYLGDAAHRASPQLGQGANMALLDAFALSRALWRHPLDEALRTYGQARRWHIAIYQGMSAAFTPQYQSDSRALPWVRDRLLFPISQMPPVPRILTRLVCGDLIPPFGSLSASGYRQPGETADAMTSAP